jgi:hypothetical protein
MIERKDNGPTFLREVPDTLKLTFFNDKDGRKGGSREIKEGK